MIKRIAPVKQFSICALPIPVLKYNICGSAITAAGMATLAFAAAETQKK